MSKTGRILADMRDPSSMKTFRLHSDLNGSGVRGGGKGVVARPSRHDQPGTRGRVPPSARGAAGGGFPVRREAAVSRGAGFGGRKPSFRGRPAMPRKRIDAGTLPTLRASAQRPIAAQLPRIVEGRGATIPKKAKLRFGMGGPNR